ncbi:hypothetical protein [Erythrobacter sp. EC-HK427]|uniref:hypothetical protein n=1 Tax=Erythrobacter sp. EC-HK427 TaxID=2038396 RepID=UPI001255ECD9|nr:hypothetical protein [Erythrobacter sp. EC-HK427]VVT00495.1 conserved hypothetical protein [Erythrobacter sp. EC-HK427]
MKRVQIRWIESQHTGDDYEQIKQAMEIGDDEGPIILLPVRQRRGGTTKASARYPAQLFENPLWLIAHLVEHGDDLNCEFWLGIYENPADDETRAATSGAWYFKELLNDVGGMNRRSRLPARAREEAETFASMTYGAISEPPLTSIDIIIENAGEAFEEVSNAFGNLPHTILISRA